MSSNQHAVVAMQKWVTDVVVAHQFCPFARRVLVDNMIEFRASDATDLKGALTDMLILCRNLDHQPQTDTALLVLPAGFSSFDSYLDLLQAAEYILADHDYEGVYQLASFHPDYCFDNCAADDAANYTNRSPYPALHLLREESLAKAIEQHPDVESIPDRNIKYTRQLGVETLRGLLKSCI
ncbi:MAG: DUF1415 domain-containing protein [Pseudomonadota bacterium]